MKEKKKLTRSKQCHKCPWKLSTDPYDIPNGYNPQKHHGLKKTIADPGALTFNSRAMACHESPVGEESYCIGWLVHQLGPGNNIGLRLKMLHYDLSDVEIFGPQHQSFEDTLPKKNERSQRQV
jgi:hypothetical protein